MKDKIRILILEDVPLDAELAERELKKDGLNYTALRVENEEGFLQALEDFKPHIVLADHSLPNFDGLSALKITLKKSPHLPFIFVSGKIGEDFAVDMLKEGATDYVLKNNLSKLPHSVIRALKEADEQRKRQIAQKTLKKREEEYRLLVENQTDLIIKLDREGRLAFVSNSFCELFNKKKKDLVGEKFLKFIAPEQRKKMQDHIYSVFLPPYSGQIEQEIIKQGHKRFISWASKAVRDNPGGVQYIVSVGRDITDRKIAEDEIIKSLEEKKLLLREIHHRVKNNLQIISALLTLQKAQIEDEKIIQLYQESQNRIQSIALIHEKLYKSPEISRIKLSDYVESLVNDLFFSYGTDRKLIKSVLDVDDVSMGIDSAIPCGFIINELVSNSLKYAFPQGKGQIKISLKSLDDGKYLLEVSDDGIGLPNNLHIENTSTLGLQIVNNLVNQIDGSLEIIPPANFKIIFKDLKYKKRI